MPQNLSFHGAEVPHTLQNGCPTREFDYASGCASSYKRGEDNNVLKFSAELQPTSNPDYFICIHRRTHTRVVITVKVKKMIDQGQWTHCLPEDREEVRSLREMGFLIEHEASLTPHA